MLMNNLTKIRKQLDISHEFCIKCGSREKLIKLKDGALCYQHYPSYGKIEDKK